MARLVIDFPDENIKEEFVGWFVDGGGDQDFDRALDIRDVELPEGSFLTLNWTEPGNLKYTFKKES